MSSITVSEAAAQLGMHPRTIRRLCRELNVGRMAGGKRLWLIEARDLKLLKANRRPVGNPAFSARKAKNRKGL